MKSIIAEAEKNALPQTPPKDGLSTTKWTPRTPPRPERMPSVPGPPMSSSPGKKVDLRMTPTITQGSFTTVRPDTKSSGLSMTRPQGVGPALGAAKQQFQSPPKTPLSPAPTTLSLTRTKSTQTSQPITPTKTGASSPSIRRTSLVSSFDHPPVSMLIFMLLGVAATHGQTRLPPMEDRPRVV